VVSTLGRVPAGPALRQKDPCAPVQHLDAIEALLDDQAFADDPDKQEFLRLFRNVRAELE